MTSNSSHASPPEDRYDADAEERIARALRRSAIALVTVVSLVGGGYLWWQWPEQNEVAEAGPVTLPQVREEIPFALPTIRFTEITEDAGITFKHCNGAEGEKLLPETMGSGCAVFDLEGDGDQDILLINACAWPWSSSADVSPLGLFANNGKGQFTDVSATWGLTESLYGMGVAIADYDGDGDADLFVSTVGENRLWQNTGSTFVDVTDEAGVGGASDAWSTSCGWFDYDRDGDLDLFVANYVRWSRDIDLQQGFQLVGIGRAYGPPTAFEGSYPYLYRNDGGGRFTEVGESLGLHVQNRATGAPMAKSLGVISVDVNDDGWLDILVANDTVQNFCFVNLGEGQGFQEVGTDLGLAFDAAGKARGAMGIDAAGFRNDDSLGVVITNFANEMTALYVRDGAEGPFNDDAIPTGLGPPTRLDLSFGVFYFDADLDGRLDLLSANGHLETEINKVQSSQHYRQPSRLFWNAGAEGDTEFVALDAARVGTDLGTPIVGRGSAYGDFDGDGDQDVLLTQVGGPPLLLRNDQTGGHHFLRLRLEGSHSNPDAIGAVIEVTRGDQTFRRQVMPTRSYLSQVELPVVIGLGADPTPPQLRIYWPHGGIQEGVVPVVDGLTTIKQSPHSD